MTIDDRLSVGTDEKFRRASDAAQIFYEEPRCVMGSFKNLAVVIWGTQATLPLAEQLETFSENLIRRYPEGVSLVQVIANQAPLPASATRDKLDRMTERFAPHLACVGTVVEGSGFWASAMQSFITSLHWVSRRPFKVKITSSLIELSTWLPKAHEERTRVRFTAPQFLSAAYSLRERIQ
ncbi:MAG TPA: hypothetical protein VH142_09200 [Polyangiaceae bacterium]|jgi:hypothetical protein|nr:hypothetical protein [Polyangiaceae bacterium]